MPVHQAIREILGRGKRPVLMVLEANVDAVNSVDAEYEWIQQVKQCKQSGDPALVSLKGSGDDIPF